MINLKSAIRNHKSAIPQDLTILENGAVFDDANDHLEYLWFHLREREDSQVYDLYRVVALRVLRYLPQESRQDTGLVQRMTSVLIGLYNQRTADYDFVELKAGIFDPPLGVMQMYGTVGLGATLDEAKRNARLGMSALRGALANFEQSRLESLSADLADWVRKALSSFPYAVVTIGQPEPKEGARGMGREGPGEVGGSGGGGSKTRRTQQPTTQQQAEMLCRAMAAVQEEFVIQTLASRVEQDHLGRMLAGVSAEASVPASMITGSEAISTGIALPFGLTQSLGESVATAYGKSQQQAVSDGLADAHGTAHIVGEATTVGHAVTDGTAHTVGSASSAGGSVSHSVTVTNGTNQGTADTAGSAHTTGHATTDGSAHTSGSSWSSSWGTSGGQSSTDSVGTSQSVGTQHGTTTTDYGAAPAIGAHGYTPDPGDIAGSGRYGSVNLPGPTQSQSQQTGVSASVSGGVSGGIPGVVGGDVGASQGANASVSQGVSQQAPSVSVPFGTVTQESGGVSQGMTASSGHSETASSGWSAGGSSGGMDSSTTSHAETNSTADTTSKAHTASQGTSHAVSTSDGSSAFWSHTSSVADTTSHAETNSWSKSQSVADSVSQATSRSHGVSQGTGTAMGQSLGLMRGLGLGAAAVPSFGLSRSYQWWNDQAARLAHMLRAQEELLNIATLDGAWFTDVYLLTWTETGAAAAEVAVRQAFQGSGPLVVTPVQTRRLSGAEQDYIRLHAMAFTPSTRTETVADVLEMYRDTTMLLPEQLAAYTTPALFEEGLTVTMQERIPAFAFVPDMPGDVVLGHLWSTERAALTSAQLRLSRERHFHTVFGADTGFGKTVAAERLAVETTNKWHYRTVVLDFGSGWRRMLNAPMNEPGRVEIWQLFPGATVPFRWNVWQVGERVQPRAQLDATCEIFKNAGRMGERQLGLMRRAARGLYLEHGVLTTDRKVLAHRAWGCVKSSQEEDAINAARCKRGIAPQALRGVVLTDLTPDDRQALAVYRSKSVDVSDWVERLEMFKADLEKKRDKTTLESLEGALMRLEVFTQGEMAVMYGKGEGSIAIEDLGMIGPASDPWGISILEGGAELSEYAKASIFGLAAWHLYADMIVRFRQEIGCRRSPPLQIFFEEANKILTGVEDKSGERLSGAVTTELFQAMWRDGRKYDVFLHPIVQTASALPRGILASCNNSFFSQTKAIQDRDAEMAHLGFSEKGFTDEDYKRFLSRMPVKMAIAKLGYSDDVIHTTPFLCQPIMVPGAMPADAEIYRAMQLLHSGGYGNADQEIYYPGWPRRSAPDADGLSGAYGGGDRSAGSGRQFGPTSPGACDLVQASQSRDDGRG